MVRRGRIEGTDRGIGHIADRRIGRERGIRIEESGPEAMREEEMMIGHPGGGENGVTRQTHTDGEKTQETETVNTENEKLLLI